jgi:hypothetical protein
MADGSISWFEMELPGSTWIGAARDPFGNRIGFVTTNAAR